jgi:hypothetical protein
MKFTIFPLSPLKVRPSYPIIWNSTATVTCGYKGHLWVCLGFLMTHPIILFIHVIIKVKVCFITHYQLQDELVKFSSKLCEKCSCDLLLVGCNSGLTEFLTEDNSRLFSMLSCTCSMFLSVLRVPSTRSFSICHSTIFMEFVHASSDDMLWWGIMNLKYSFAGCLNSSYGGSMFKSSSIAEHSSIIHFSMSWNSDLGSALLDLRYSISTLIWKKDNSDMYYSSKVMKKEDGFMTFARPSLLFRMYVAHVHVEIL